jgi:hypothetical protein
MVSTLMLAKEALHMQETELKKFYLLKSIL